jgi:hypothetical protein
MGINKSTIHQTLEGMPLSGDSVSMKEAIDHKERLVELDRIEDENETRHDLTRYILQFNAFWMVCVLTILALTGQKILLFSDTVIVTLLTTTTAQVLGFGIIVTNYLYKQTTAR